MHICVFEDRYYRNLLPLVYFRPVYELRCGINSLLHNITAEFPRVPLTLSVRHNLANLVAENYPGAPVNLLTEDDTLFLNGRILRMEGLRELIGKDLRNNWLMHDGDDIAAAYCMKKNISSMNKSLRDGIFNASILRGFKERVFTGKLIRYSWDLIHGAAEEIERDFERIRKQRAGAAKIYKGAHIIGRKNIVFSGGVTVKPGAVLDAEKGPIILGENVIVMSNAFIQGPVFIGHNSIIKAGATIYPGTSIGELCKVGGEVECSIIQSHSNKQHSGYLGHSYLGSWVNLGADTNTSDLKNNYSTIRVSVDGTMVDSGQQFMGLTMGDHSKSGINVMFDTGSVVGVSCNIYGAGLPSKFIPSFSWGGGTAFTCYDVDKSIDTMKKVMARRRVEMSSEYEGLVRNIFHQTHPERRKEGVK
jgi:UDP-N-acetylglucosamine diphosphorylase/glucosamine-1-phosphate N-acetyltransferase